MKILIVEDEPTIADLAAENLRLDNHDVDTAYTHSQACELAANNYDWLIIDLLLDNGETGWSYARHFAEMHPTTDIVLCTAHEDKLAQIRHELPLYRVKGVFIKPVDYLKVRYLVTKEKHVDYADVAKMENKELRDMIDCLNERINEHSRKIDKTTIWMETMTEKVGFIHDTVRDFVNSHQNDWIKIVGAVATLVGIVTSVLYFFIGAQK